MLSSIDFLHNIIYLLRYHIANNMGKHSQGKTLTVLLFFIQPQMFSVNHGLIDQQYKSTEMLQQKFYCE